MRGAPTLRRDVSRDAAVPAARAQWPGRSLRSVGGVVLLALLAACASGTRAPIEQKSATPPPAATSAARPAPPAPWRDESNPTVHVVTRGDTVHAIAWRYRLDYRELIRWNELENPNLIFVGQRLRLTAPPRSAARARTTPTPAVARAAVPAVTTAGAKPRRPAVAVPASGPLRWVWPATGKTTRSTSISGSKGLEIHGQRGQDIKAAAAGSVVYSGSGLRGYGELIIVQHNDTFLSAYAHNDSRLVQEGGRVDAGETIARMGNTDAKDVMLHFEIRRNGKAVDPLQYLPRR